MSLKTQAVVEPVYVATPSELMLSDNFQMPKSSRLQAAALLAMKKSLKSAKLRCPGSPKVILSNESFNTTLSTQTLANYAARSACDLIVMGTQSKRGVERFFLGSFAETLLYHAKTPVLLVGPKVKSSAKISKILFSTDFSPESIKAFRKLCKFASSVNAEIYVFHVVQDVMAFSNPFDGLYMGSEALLFAEAIRAQKKSSQKRLSAMISTARTLRVKVRGEVVQSHENIGSLAVKRAAKLGADLIALATQSGPIRAALGSVARDIVRRSPIPLWVHPRRA